MEKMHQDLQEILVTQQELELKVTEMAKIISEDYKGKEILLITVLKGGIMFSVDLMRKLTVPVEIDFMAVSSYGNGAKTSGVVQIIKDLSSDVVGKNILIVEDIIDSGLTLKYLKELLLARGPASIKICAILNKPDRRQADIEIDYLGIEIPDEFVVGYGLDYAEKYRNLPYVGVLKREVYE